MLRLKGISVLLKKGAIDQHQTLALSLLLRSSAQSSGFIVKLMPERNHLLTSNTSERYVARLVM